MTGSGAGRARGAEGPACAEVPARAEVPVSVKGLSLAIDSRPILKDIDVEIARGEFVGLLGANGAGKSTLLRVIATLVRPTGGRLALFGQPVTRESAALRARIGLIAHQSMLYRDLSARENLLFFARLYGIAGAEARVGNLLEVMGLSQRSGDAVKTFSRGMTQRVAIARALLHDPELILADEPFDGLDAPSIEATGKLLTHLHQSGKTIVLVNHDIGTSLALVKRVMVLRRGQVAMDRVNAGLTTGDVLAEMGAS